MDLFLYGTSDVNAVDRKDQIMHVNVEHVTKVFRGTTIQRFESYKQYFELTPFVDRQPM